MPLTKIALENDSGAFTHHIPFSKMIPESEGLDSFSFPPPPFGCATQTSRILAPDQELNLCPCSGCVEPLPLGHQGIP